MVGRGPRRRSVTGAAPDRLCLGIRAGHRAGCAGSGEQPDRTKKPSPCVGWACSGGPAPPGASSISTTPTSPALGRPRSMTLSGSLAGPGSRDRSGRSWHRLRPSSRAGHRTRLGADVVVEVEEVAGVHRVLQRCEPGQLRRRHSLGDGGNRVPEPVAPSRTRCRPASAPPARASRLPHRSASAHARLLRPLHGSRPWRKGHMGRDRHARHDSSPAGPPMTPVVPLQPVSFTGATHGRHGPCSGGWSHRGGRGPPNESGADPAS